MKQSMCLFAGQFRGDITDKKLANARNLERIILEQYRIWDENLVSEDAALRPDLIGMQIFEEPLLGISDAADPLYHSLKQVNIVGPWHKLPGEWLPDPVSVISLFFPFTEQVKKAQQKEIEVTSPEWLHGRIEGQEAMLDFAKKISSNLKEQGYAAVIPVISVDFHAMTFGKGITGYAEITEKTFGSNWSERHVAYISGLGTFGLSRGLITKRGTAGRFCSIVTDMPLPATEREYTRYDEWCSRCGACVQRCPVGAITLEHGKDHIPCGRRINESKIRYAPRYGCGQCQSAVPCESSRCIAK